MVKCHHIDYNIKGSRFYIKKALDDLLKLYNISHIIYPFKWYWVIQKETKTGNMIIMF